MLIKATKQFASAGLFWRFAPFLFLLLWSGGYSFAKLGLDHVEPLTMLALRYGLAVLVLLAALLFYKPTWPKQPSHWLAIATTGFLIQCVYFGLAYLSMKHGMHAGTTAIIMALQPILVAATSPFIASTQGSRKLWLGLVMGFLGVLLVVWSDGQLGAGSLYATGLALMALGGITGATLFEKWHGRKTDPVVSGLVQYVVGFSVLFPAARESETMLIDWHPALIISLAYLVVANSLISIALYIALIHRGDATRISAFMYLVPPLALIFAWLILGESIGLLTLAGLALSVTGVYIVNKQSN